MFLAFSEEKVRKCKPQLRGAQSTVAKTADIRVADIGLKDNRVVTRVVYNRQINRVADNWWRNRVMDNWVLKVEYHSFLIFFKLSDGKGKVKESQEHTW